MHSFMRLETGKISVACLDAFEAEPPHESPLFKTGRVIATPHAGAHTAECGEKDGNDSRG